MGNYEDWLNTSKPVPWSFMEQPQAPELKLEQPPEVPATGSGIGDILKNLSMAKVGDIALKNALPLAFAGRLATKFGGASNSPLTRAQDMVLQAAGSKENQQTINKGNTFPRPRSTSLDTSTTDPLATTNSQKRLSAWDSFFNQK